MHVEAAGAKWEAREKRFLDDMRQVIRNHDSQQENTVMSEQLAVEQQKLCTLTEEFRTCKGAVQERRERGTQTGEG